MPYPIFIDPGAAESVLPIGWCPQAQTTPGAESRKYTAANGSTISNKGENVVSMATRAGKWKSIRFQVCDVTRPLVAVHKICEMGHPVIFNPSWDARGSFTVNQETVEKIWMTSKDGVFVLETKIAPAKYRNKPGFGRQGR